MLRRTVGQVVYPRALQQRNNVRTISMAACRARSNVEQPPSFCMPHSNHTDSGCCSNYSKRFLSTQRLSISRRDLAALEDEVLQKVGRSVKDPVLGKTLQSLRWIDRRITINEENQSIVITILVPTLLHPSLQQLQEEIRTIFQEELKSWMEQRGQDALQNIGVEVNIRATKPNPMAQQQLFADDKEELIKNLGPGLANVGHFVGVYSCKGGVGKSTVAVNLAYELQRMGGRVGILDVDIYGPSLPILVTPDDQSVRPSPLGKGMVYPIEHKGVKLMSLGFVSPNSGVPGSGPNAGAAVMRGPMAGRVVAQLLKGTDWGELDVLILDLPPGTGDVQLAVCQDLQLSGAIAVTTPSKLAKEDTRKGIQMFTSLGVSTLALVENMSYFMCEGGGKHYPFGNTHNDANAVDVTVDRIELPISTQTNTSNDSGTPLCLERPIDAAVELLAFEKLAGILSKELLTLQYEASEKTSKNENESSSSTLVTFGDEHFPVESIMIRMKQERRGTDDRPDKLFSMRLYSDKGATERDFLAATLRDCNPKTGASLVSSHAQSRSTITDKNKTATADYDGMVTVHKASAPRKVTPLPSHSPSSIEKKGRYGYAVEWEDGATIIYSNESIAIAAGGTLTQG